MTAPLISNFKSNYSQNTIDRKSLLTDNWFFNIFFLLLLTAMASLPFTNLLMLPVAILMFLNWIAEWNWKEKWENMRGNASITTIIIFFSIYLVVIYGFFLFSMTLSALSLSIMMGFNNVTLIMMFAGGLLFTISDLILSGTYFGKGKERPVDIITNSVTYYAAQFVIALALFFI